MNVLDRIERAEVPVSSILSPQDQKILQHHLREYGEIRQHLLKALNDFEQRLSTVLYPSQVIEYNGEYQVRINPDRTGYYRYLYDVANDIAQVKNKLIGLNKHLTTAIAKHVNSTYYLALSFPDYGTKQISETTLLDELKKQAKGSSLQNLGIERLKSIFAEKVYRPVRIKNRVLQIDGYTHIKERWSGEYRLDYTETEKMNILFQAISFFEQQILSNQLPCLAQLPGNNHNYLDIEFREYPIGGSNTVEGLRFYKNRRLDIRFKSFEQARSFSDTFRLPFN